MFPTLEKPERTAERLIAGDAAEVAAAVAPPTKPVDRSLLKGLQRWESEGGAVWSPV